VEKDTDVFSIEKAGKFSGHYCVIGELDHRNPLGDIQKQRLQKLKNRVVEELKGTPGEIIIALGPNTFGDFVSELIRQGFKGISVKITRLGRGIPTGGDIEFADEETLRNAFEGRR
jgi:recombination protein RecR